MPGFYRMAAAILRAVGLGAARFETELGPAPINSVTNVGITFASNPVGRPVSVGIRAVF